MSTLKGIRPIEPLDWVLVANAARARVFERDPENNAMRELSSFVHPQSRQKGQALGRDRPGKAQKGSTASTAFPPHTDLHQKEHAEFAHELAQHLEEAALAHRYPRVALVASSPFLGELKAQLGAAAKKLLQAAVALDLTSYEGADLEHRVAQALQAVEASAPIAGD
ncbi:MAG: host attachment protein [Rubrivivax sp.]|nr:host attachment protein [Rubrivivax sp.]